MLIFTALVSALAAGAVWALTAAAWPGSFHLIGLLVALAIGWTLRATAPRSFGVAVLAALALVFAAYYAASLDASLRLANALGISMREVLTHNGLTGLTELGRAALHASDVPGLVSAIVLAAVVILAPRRTPR